MSSYVENEAGAGFDFDIKEVFDEVAKGILDSEGCPYETQVNLLITDNAGIREYNRQYRQIDAPTDVLSFPMMNWTSSIRRTSLFLYLSRNLDMDILLLFLMESISSLVKTSLVTYSTRLCGDASITKWAIECIRWVFPRPTPP